MKTILLYLILLNIPSYCFSQDIIYKTDGNEIKARVIEIAESTIKYKNFEQQDGPIRNISKSEVFMIKYQDGTTEKFTTILNLKAGSANDTTKEKRKTTSEEIDFQIQRAKAMKGTGVFLLIPGAACLLVGGVTLVSKKDISYILIAVSVPFIISGITLASIGQSRLSSCNKRKAELGFQMVPFNDINNGKIMSGEAISMGVRISF